MIAPVARIHTGERGNDRSWILYSIAGGLLALIALVNFVIPRLVEPGKSVKSEVQPTDNHIFFDAIRQGNTARVESFLDSGTSPDSVECGDCGLSALAEASSQGKLDIVKVLLRRGATVDMRPRDGSTALVHAVIRRHPDVAKELLRAGANPNIDHGSALFMAVAMDDVAMAGLLLDSGANPNLLDSNGSTPLINALEGNTMQLLLKAKDTLTEKNIGDVLKQANVNIGMVHLLIEKKADVNLRDSRGSTALFYAAKKGQLETVRELLDAGANPDEATVPRMAIYEDPEIRKNREILQWINQASKGLSGK